MKKNYELLPDLVFTASDDCARRALKCPNAHKPTK
jgi:hypothetical protein